MRLDFVDLKLFMLLAETGNLTAAADALPCALSAASQRLKKLETLFGLPLVERHARGVVLTAAGDVLLQHARQLIAGAEQLSADLADLAGGVRSEVKLMANSVAWHDFLPPVLGAFLARETLIDVQLIERNSRDIVTAIAAGEAEIGVLDGNVGGGEMTLLPFAHDKLVLIVPVGHALAGRDGVPLSEALGQAFVGLPEKSAIQRFIEQMARAYGKPLKPRTRMGSFAAVAALVSAGAGVSILPERAALALEAQGRVAVVPLSDPWAERDLKLCVKSVLALSAPARALLSHLMAAYAENGVSRPLGWG
ncbi:LysR family transcriptional regulator [Crenobacter cavernae]|uniref:LysR family transcriptional regulator n=1 Tax=Crenobacter cavernae TaxID=2290923 RepID=A0ABY0FA84_9NEIS|nr:LysR family transcriptional regulator [Crenobacter cavernae]RXZ42516.1 LysR family transcriptional regulator [Crenobacter cavernae]